MLGAVPGGASLWGAWVRFGGGVGLGGGGSFLRGGGAESVGGGAGVDDVGVEGQAVYDCGGQAGVGEGGAPFGEGGVGGAGDGGAFFSFGDDLEEEFGAAGVEVDVADFVEAEQVDAGIAANDAGELVVGGGFGELVDQGGGGDVADPAALFGGGGAQCDE